MRSSKKPALEQIDKSSKVVKAEAVVEVPARTKASEAAHSKSAEQPLQSPIPLPASFPDVDRPKTPEPVEIECDAEPPRVVCTASFLSSTPSADVSQDVPSSDQMKGKAAGGIASLAESTKPSCTAPLPPLVTSATAAQQTPSPTKHKSITGPIKTSPRKRKASIAKPTSTPASSLLVVNSITPGQPPFNTAGASYLSSSRAALSPSLTPSSSSDRSPPRSSVSSDSYPTPSPPPARIRLPPMGYPTYQISFKPCTTWTKDFNKMDLDGGSEQYAHNWSCVRSTASDRPVFERIIGALAALSALATLLTVYTISQASSASSALAIPCFQATHSKKCYPFKLSFHCDQFVLSIRTYTNFAHVLATLLHYIDITTTFNHPIALSSIWQHLCLVKLASFVTFRCNIFGSQGTSIQLLNVYHLEQIT